MNEVFKVILSMSLSGSIVIIFLIPFLHLFQKRLTRRWQYYIWLIAVFRLLIPLAPRENLMNTVFQAVEGIGSSAGEEAVSKVTEGRQEGEEITEDEELEGGQQEMAGGGTGDSQQPVAKAGVSEEQWQSVDEKMADGKQQIADGKMMDRKQQIADGKTIDGRGQLADGKIGDRKIAEYLWLVWMAPAIFLFIRKMIAYRRFVKYMHETSQEVQEMELLEALGRLVEKSRVRACVSLLVNSHAVSPMMTGFLRPCIILPSVEISASDFEYTILHELLHYRRRDMFYQWLVQFTVCLHWFNPFVYLLQRQIRKDCELSCDEGVIQELDAGERYVYGDVLLRAARGGLINKNSVVFMAQGENAKLLKERLDAIMNYRKRTRVTFVLTAMMAVMISLGASYIGVYAAGGGDVALAAGMISNENAAFPAGIVSGAASVVKTSTGNSSQAEHSVLYKEGEYFILFDGVKDIPGTTGPDFGVTFTAVWRDGYIGFNSYYINKNLTAKIKKECAHMQGKGWLTKKESNAIVAVAAKVQAGDTNGFQTDTQGEEYADFGIIKKNGAYYYEDKRVRILMDVRTDKSFENFAFDRKGTVDLLVVRKKNNEIKAVKYLSKKRAKKILREL